MDGRRSAVKPKGKPSTKKQDPVEELDRPNTPLAMKEAAYAPGSPSYTPHEPVPQRENRGFKRIPQGDLANLAQAVPDSNFGVEEEEEYTPADKRPHIDDEAVPDLENTLTELQTRFPTTRTAISLLSETNKSNGSEFAAVLNSLMSVTSSLESALRTMERELGAAKQNNQRLSDRISNAESSFGATMDAKKLCKAVLSKTGSRATPKDKLIGFSEPLAERISSDKALREKVLVGLVNTPSRAAYADMMTKLAKHASDKGWV